MAAAFGSIEPWSATPIVSGVPLRLESIAVWGARLIVGTTDGTLLVYGPSAAKPDAYEVVAMHKQFARRAISQLEVHAELGVVLSLSDGALSVHALEPQLRALGTVPAPKGCGCFALTREGDGAEVLLAAACRRKVHVFRWETRSSSFVELAEFVLADASAPPLKSAVSHLTDAVGSAASAAGSGSIGSSLSALKGAGGGGGGGEGAGGAGGSGSGGGATLATMLIWLAEPRGARELLVGTRREYWHWRLGGADEAVGGAGAAGAAPGGGAARSAGSQGAARLLFRFAKPAPPVGARMAPGEALLVQERDGTFIGLRGEFTRPSGLYLRTPPVLLAYTPPYVLTVVPPGGGGAAGAAPGSAAAPAAPGGSAAFSVEVRLLHTHALVAALPLPQPAAAGGGGGGASHMLLWPAAPPAPSAAAGGGGGGGGGASAAPPHAVLVATPSALLLLRPLPMRTLVRSLARADRFEAAMLLCESVHGPTPPAARATRARIERLRAYALLRAERYDEAAVALLDARAPPLEVLSLYPRLLPARVRPLRVRVRLGAAAAEGGGAEGGGAGAGAGAEAGGSGPRRDAMRAGSSGTAVPAAASTAETAAGADSAADTHTAAAAAEAAAAEAAAAEAAAAEDVEDSFEVAPIKPSSTQQTVALYSALRAYLEAARRSPELLPPLPTAAEPSARDSGAAAAAGAAPAVPGGAEAELARRCVDTALFKVLLSIDQPAVRPLLQQPTTLDVAEAEAILLRFSKHAELVALYQARGLHSHALALLAALGGAPGAPTEFAPSAGTPVAVDAAAAAAELRGVGATVSYLRTLGPAHLDTVLQWARWPVQAAPEDALRIFADEGGGAAAPRPARAPLPAEPVFAFLAQHGSRALAMRFLERALRPADAQPAGGADARGGAPRAGSGADSGSRHDGSGSRAAAAAASEEAARLARLHDELARSYLQRICELAAGGGEGRGHAPSAEGAPAPEAGGPAQHPPRGRQHEADELRAVRARCRNFLETSRTYDAEALLAAFSARAAGEEGGVDARTAHVLAHERALLLRRLGRHEAALRVLLDELGDREAADAYCLAVDSAGSADAADEPPAAPVAGTEAEGAGADAAQGAGADAPARALRRAGAHDALLRVLLRPSDGGAPDVEAALAVLRAHAAHVDADAALRLLPAETPLALVSGWLQGVMRLSAHQTRAQRVARSMHKAETLRLRAALGEARARSVLVKADTLCGVCAKPIKSAAFWAYPNGVVVHAWCMAHDPDPHVCPVTREDFRRRAAAVRSAGLGVARAGAPPAFGFPG